MTGGEPEPLTLGGGGRRCVELLLVLHPLAEQAAVGTRIDIVTGDPAAALDLPAWCHLTGHLYFGRIGQGGDVPTYAIRTAVGRPWHTTDDRPGGRRAEPTTDSSGGRLTPRRNVLIGLAVRQDGPYRHPHQLAD